MNRGSVLFCKKYSVPETKTGNGTGKFLETEVLQWKAWLERFCDAYDAMIQDSKYTENKELLVIPGAVHTDLYDNIDVIPFNKMDDFFRQNM